MVNNATLIEEAHRPRQSLDPDATSILEPRFWPGDLRDHTETLT